MRINESHSKKGAVVVFFFFPFFSFFTSEMVQSSEGGSRSPVHANFAFDPMNKGTPLPATYCRLHRELPDQKQLSSRLSSAATRLVRAQRFSFAFPFCVFLQRRAPLEGLLPFNTCFRWNYYVSKATLIPTGVKNRDEGFLFAVPNVTRFTDRL